MKSFVDELLAKWSRRTPRNRVLFVLAFALSLFQVLCHAVPAPAGAQGARPVVIITISGPINPATDDFLRASMQKANDRNAQLLVIKLNTPGGLLTSMQTMVETLLDDPPVPTVVYVSPSGGSAMSAGTFLTLAGHFAVMAPGTTIGAAHPVLSSGGDVQGHMGAKVENFAVSVIRAIAEQRGRNAAWAEKAVRESVAITDRDAVQEKVIDFVASDLASLLDQLEGRTVTVKGKSAALTGVRQAPQEVFEMNLKQSLVNILADPNIAILLGLGALLGLGIELYHPGAVFPGIVGVVCLILSLTAGQVLPISYGGVALLLLGVGFFIVEMFVPTFGVWGVAGVVCFVLGSIYFIDSEQVWSTGGFTVDRVLIGTMAAAVGALLLSLCYLTLRSGKQLVSTGPERLKGLEAVVIAEFKIVADGRADGKVRVSGEIWNARTLQTAPLPNIGDRVRVVASSGLFVEVEQISA